MVEQCSRRQQGTAWAGKVGWLPEMAVMRVVGVDVVVVVDVVVGGADLSGVQAAKRAAVRPDQLPSVVHNENPM
jgi:hypothetical protein